MNRKGKLSAENDYRKIGFSVSYVRKQIWGFDLFFLKRYWHSTRSWIKGIPSLHVVRNRKCPIHIHKSWTHITLEEHFNKLYWSFGISYRLGPKRKFWVGLGRYDFIIAGPNYSSGHTIEWQHDEA